MITTCYQFGRSLEFVETQFRFSVLLCRKIGSCLEDTLTCCWRNCFIIVQCWCKCTILCICIYYFFRFNEIQNGQLKCVLTLESMSFCNFLEHYLLSYLVFSICIHVTIYNGINLNHGQASSVILEISLRRCIRKNP